MTLVVHKNRDVKENSLDAYEGIMIEIANGLLLNNRRHRNLFDYIMDRLTKIIKKKSSINIS